MNKNLKKLFIIFFAAVFFMLVSCAAAVIFIDPFFHFHAPLKNFPYEVDNQIYQNPGMAMHLDYNAFITGSSMTVNFDTDDFSEDFGKTIKLSYDGAYPANLSAIMDFVFDKNSFSKKNNQIHTAFICLDIISLTADPYATKYPLDDYLYGKKDSAVFTYLLNKEVIIDYILKPILKRKPTDLSEVYSMYWLTDDLTGKDYVLKGYEAPKKSSTPADKNIFLDKTRENLEKNLIPYIKANPDTEFIFFFPAYSILFWNEILAEGTLDARLEQTRLIFDTLLEYDNVRIFYFSDAEEMITDLDLYTDYTHHVKSVSSYEAACFSSSEHEVFKENIEIILKNMEKIVRSFDFENLLEQNDNDS